MKWLYRILRLFFCPHKWIEKERYDLSYQDNTRFGISMILKCKYCGQIREKKLTPWSC